MRALNAFFDFCKSQFTSIFNPVWKAKVAELDCCWPRENLGSSKFRNLNS
jgi:hypothetical protein